MNSSKLDTGYDIGKLNLIGFVDSSDNDKYYLYHTDLDPSIQCQSCCLSLIPWKCNELELKRMCKEYHYVYFESKRKGSKSRHVTVDLHELAIQCMDRCIFYEPNCYNKNKNMCTIRIIEENTCHKP